ncbi:MAG TPA: aminotransferase class V-fold PLP-dependent enzyme [Casimicrobiaceae bacterium]|nr:aminotransferase class V-fold PLP-dependent enzyme [Casimicrobiaceae bacterium]
MPGLLPDVDPDGLLEYSVVYTDRALNHMSRAFQRVMNEVADTLESAYRAKAAVIVPGSGTFGMEAVARQFATRKRCLVVRNGWFSYRWSQIFEMGDIPASTTVLKARRIGSGPHAPFAPAPLDEIVGIIKGERPDLVFAPHVETASGIMLPDAYLQSIADAAHSVGAMFVLDCIASGTLWVDMQALGVDILISAPQKGWSSAAGYAMVMLGERARAAIDATTSTSFACDLKKWLSIMDAYKGGGHAYHATMPTDSLAQLRDAMQELERFGFERAKAAQTDLGAKVRRLLADRGMPSVAAKGFEAPTVVVSYTDDPGIQSGSGFVGVGLQTAAGVPLQCDEPADFKTFRIGLFGLDKLGHVDRTVRILAEALTQLGR